MEDTNNLGGKKNMAKGSRILSRIWASKGGAFFMFIVYVVAIAALSFFDYTFYDLPRILGYIIVPGALLLGISSGTGTYLGVPTTVLFLSLVMYMALGYLIDWFYKPYE